MPRVSREIAGYANLTVPTTSDTELQISPVKTGTPRDAREHLWTDLVFVVEGEHHVRISRSRENLVRTGFSFDMPAYAQQRGENALCFS